MSWVGLSRYSWLVQLLPVLSEVCSLGTAIIWHELSSWLGILAYGIRHMAGTGGRDGWSWM